MRLSSIFIPLLAAGLLVSACSKRTSPIDPDPTGPITSMDDVTAPDGFEYGMITTREVQSVVFGYPYLGKAKVMYYGVNGNRKELLAEVMQLARDTTTVELTLPEVFQRIHIQANFPDGSISLGTHALEPGVVMTAYPAEETAGPNYAPAYKVSGPGCNCPTTVASVSGNKLTVAAGDTVCVTGGLNGKSIEVKTDGELRICGTFSSIQGIVLEQGANLVLNDNASLLMANGKQISVDDNGSLEVFDGATLSIARDLNLRDGASLLNYGTVSIGNRLNVFVNGSTTNHSTLTIGGDFVVDGTGAAFDNYGFTSTDNNKSIKIENNAVYNNYCRTLSDKNIQLDDDGVVNNYGQFEANDNLEIDDDAVLNMYAGSLALCDDLEFDDGTINGLGGAPSLVKVVDDADWSSGANATGDVKWCVGDKNSNYASVNVSGNVQFDCNTYIATSACITVGNGISPDTDGDGVPDANDFYPNDASRWMDLSGNTFTLAFEDTWPNQGDYDFNDFVCAYTLVKVVDPNSKVKDLKFAYKVLARGAAYDNGFGFQLNVPRTNVQSVSGSRIDTLAPYIGANGAESGNALASVIVFDNIDDISFSWNTDWTYINPYTNVPWDTVTISFVNAIEDSLLNSFNPYLIINGDRTHEVHLPNYAPTSLADMSKFGIGSDDSDPGQGRYYMTADNQPWGLHLPIVFEHPIEHEDITQVYLNFGVWAITGGQSYPTWYDANTPSNVDDSKLF